MSEPAVAATLARPRLRPVRNVPERDSRRDSCDAALTARLIAANFLRRTARSGR